MKPRNRFEKAVLAESKKLRPISKTQCKWAFRECIDHFAYRLPKGVGIVGQWRRQPNIALALIVEQSCKSERLLNVR